MPEPHLAAAGLLEKQKNFDAAAREYQTAAELDPKSQEALTGLANVSSAQKKYAEAEAALRKLLRPIRKTPRPALNWGVCFRPKARATKRRRSCKRATGTSRTIPMPPWSWARFTEGWEERRSRAAVSHCSSEAAAGSRGALTRSASLLMHEKKYPEAQRELLAAINLKPDFGEAYGILAIVAASQQAVRSVP